MIELPIKPEVLGYFDSVSTMFGSQWYYILGGLILAYFVIHHIIKKVVMTIFIVLLLGLVAVYYFGLDVLSLLP